MSADDDETDTHHTSTRARQRATHRHHGSAAQRPPATERPAHPKPPPATRGTLPTQIAPPGGTHLETASPAFAPLALNPCVRSPARVQGDGAGGSGNAGPRAPAPTLPHLTANDAPSPLGPLDAHISAHPWLISCWLRRDRLLYEDERGL